MQKTVLAREKNKYLNTGTTMEVEQKKLHERWANAVNEAVPAQKEKPAPTHHNTNNYTGTSYRSKEPNLLNIEIKTTQHL